MQKKLGVGILVFAFVLLLGLSALVYKNSSKIDTESQLAAAATPKITNVSKNNINTTGVTITWNTATVADGKAQVKKSWESTWSNIVTETNTGTAHSVTFTNLAPQTTYNYKVTSCEVASGKCNTYTSSSKFTTTTQTTTDTTAPTTPTNVIATNMTATGATISWTASTDAVGVTGYNIYQTGSNTPINGSTLITATSYTLTGLVSATPYSFAVKAKDAAGNMSAISNPVSFSTIATIDTTKPTTPSALTLISKTYNSIAFSWTGSTDNIAVTGYRVYVNGVDVNGTDTFTSITLSANINPGTTYSLTVYAKDAAGNLSNPSSALLVTTDAQPDTQAPTTPSNLSASNLTASSVDIAWNGSTDNVGLLGYEVYVNNTKVGSTASATSIHVSGLAENTTYSFKIRALDASGNYSDSTILPVTTLSDIPPAPTNLTLISKTYDSIAMQWNAPTTTGSAIASYEIYESGVKIGTTATATSITASNLTGSTTYNFTVKAKNVLGHLSSASNTLTVTTDATPDTTVPTAPSGLNAPAGEVTTNSLNLYWNVSTDNVGVVEYQVFQNGTLIGGTTTALSMPVTGLTPATTYTFTMKAKDAAGNLSPLSTSLSVTTKTAADTTAPTTPTGVVASSITQTSAVISWNASTDNVGVAGYNVYKNGSTSPANTSLVTGTSRTSTGLTAGTAYSYTVRAVDAAGNMSAISTAASFTTTSAADTTAPTISTISATPNTTGVTITWTTNEAADSQISYGTTTAYGTTSVLDTTLATSHSVTITGLNSATTYHFKVTSKDAAANSASSTDQTFTTTTATTSTCLNDITNPADGRDVWAWHGLTELMTDGSAYQTTFFNYADTHKVQTIYINSYPTFFNSATNVANMKTFLNKAKAHCMDVEALGGAENWIVTPGNPYIIPTGVTIDPGSALTTDPKNLRVSNVGLTTATLNWDIPTDTTGLSGYNIYKSAVASGGTYSGTKVNSSLITGTTYNLTGLTQGKNYTYMVKRVDGSGNVSTTQASNLLKFGMYTNEATDFATAVKNFNDSITGTNAKFSGIQYDVEPHTISDTDGYYPYYGLSDATYTEPQANQKILNALIDMTQSVRAITGASVKVTLAPPRWYDTSAELTPFSRTGVGVTGKNAMQYLFDNVDVLAIQDYVNTPSRIYNDAKNELNYAASTGKKVKIGILLDYSSDAPTSTYYGSTCTALYNDLQSAYNMMTATEKSGFGAYAIEQYDTSAGYSAGTPSSWSGMCQ